MARKTKRETGKNKGNGSGLAVSRSASSKKTAENLSKMETSEVSFEFIKSNNFRVIAVDGGFGGISPRGHVIHLAIYSERRPIPRKTVHTVSEIGKVGKELTDKREERDGFVREVEADLILDINAATVIRDWLSEKITDLAKIQTQIIRKARPKK